MLVFLDIEASSLEPDSYPIEIGWVFENGAGEAHLIQPETDWKDWASSAQNLHQISRATLARDGSPAEAVGQRLVAALTGHVVCSDAAGWDGRWLGCLLRAAGLPGQSLTLTDTRRINHAAARTILGDVLCEPALGEAVGDVLALVRLRHRGGPVHRALADAQRERQGFMAVRCAALAMAARIRSAHGALQRSLIPA